MTLTEPARATGLLGEQHLDAVLVDHTIGAEAATAIVRAADAVERRIVLVTPSERHSLPALKDAGFTGYLVKPIRAASLKARLVGSSRCLRRHARRCQR